jgi:hypothetical protein
MKTNEKNNKKNNEEWWQNNENNNENNVPLRSHLNFMIRKKIMKCNDTFLCWCPDGTSESPFNMSGN